MRTLADDAMLDDHGQLYLLSPGEYDSFARPGYIPPRVWKATGCTFEDVPTYGWPLGVIYRNNPLQFATAETAGKIAALVAQILGAGYVVEQYVEEVTVGPYRWAGKRMLRITGNGHSVEVNAGLQASTQARAPEHFATAAQALLK